MPFWRCVLRLRIVTLFYNPINVIRGRISERLQRLCGQEIYLRCYIVANIAAPFVIVENANGQICILGESVCSSRDRPRRRTAYVSFFISFFFRPLSPASGTL